MTNDPSTRAIELELSIEDPRNVRLFGCEALINADQHIARKSDKGFTIPNPLLGELSDCTRHTVTIHQSRGDYVSLGPLHNP